MNSEEDLRLLYEIAFEIRAYKCVGLPRALSRFIKTKRGKFVALLLEELSVKLIKEGAAAQMKIEGLENEINGLRNENQQLTDLLFKEEGICCVCGHWGTVEKPCRCFDSPKL